jgi:hypothetical protein
MRSGPNVRVGFIDAPEIGLPLNPAKAMYAPTPQRGDDPDVLRARSVPRITLANPNVKSSSIQNPAPAVYPEATWFNP